MSDIIKQFLKQAHRIGKERLQLCSSGNLSWRIEANQALISGTGSWLQRLKKEDVSLCCISDGKLLRGAKPSMESLFHFGILRARQEVNVVLHFQSKYATAVSCMKNKPSDFNITVEIPCYVGSEIPIIPYLRPGSPELAEAVVNAMRNHDCLLLSNHGQVVCGEDFNDVLQKALFFEMACSIILLAGEGNYQALDKKEIEELKKYINGKREE